MPQIERAYQNFIEARMQRHQRRQLVEILRPDARRIEVGGKCFINFSGNDYLGLSMHPDLKKRAAAWAQIYGAGCGASRLVIGNVEVFAALEEKLAAFKQKESALIMVSGFQANASVLPALFDRQVLGAEPLVFADRLNHASLHLGCAAAGVRQIRFQHNDMDHLEHLLQQHADPTRPKFILTESVFSMDGDLAPMQTLSQLAQAYECFLICDDAHATGVLGARGRGLSDQADMVIGTFSKAMGSFGAYVACSAVLKDYLINRCAGLIYATALPPAVLGSIDAALDLVPTLDAERAHVQVLAQAFGQGVGAQVHSQIVPVHIGADADALAVALTLKDAGFWVTAIRPPTVPRGTARLRVTFSAAHRMEDVLHLAKALK